MLGIFGGVHQILIVAATLLVIFSLLGCAMCYWKYRGDHCSYVLNPAMTMPINKPPEREFYV
jgi:predicted Co/Zn/Cd cation transporter (cation efflux family)